MLRNEKKRLACLTAGILALFVFLSAACSPFFRWPSGDDENSSVDREALREELYEAFDLSGVKGLSATMEATEGSVDGYLEAAATWNEEGVFSADAYLFQNSSSVRCGFIRDADFLEGAYGYDCYVCYVPSVSSSEYISEGASAAENIAAVREYISANKDTITGDKLSISWISESFLITSGVGEERQNYLDGFGVLLAAVEKLPSFFGGEADVDGSGYTLTYSIQECADLLAEILNGILEKVDANPEMTCEEFSELSEIVSLTSYLFADDKAPDMQKLFKVAFKCLFAEGFADEISLEALAAVDFDGILPEAPAGRSAGGYLRDCIAALPQIVEDVVAAMGETEQDREWLTPRFWLESLLSVFGCNVAEEETLGSAFTEWYDAKTAAWEAYDNEECFVLYFDEDKTPTGLGIYLSVEQWEEIGALSMNVRLNFHYETIELTDLTGIRYLAGYQNVDGTYEELVYGLPDTVTMRAVVGINGDSVTVSLFDETGEELLWTTETEKVDLAEGISDTFRYNGILYQVEITASGGYSGRWIGRDYSREDQYILYDIYVSLRDTISGSGGSTAIWPSIEYLYEIIH